MANTPNSISRLRGIQAAALYASSNTLTEHLTAADLNDAILVCLEESGLRLVSAEEQEAIPGAPYVYCELNLVRRSDIDPGAPAGDDTHVGYLLLELYQSAALVRDPDTQIPVSVWSVGGQFAGTPDTLVDRCGVLLGELIASFGKAYRQANTAAPAPLKEAPPVPFFGLGSDFLA